LLRGKLGLQRRNVPQGKLDRVSAPRTCPGAGSRVYGVDTCLLRGPIDLLRSKSQNRNARALARSGRSFSPADLRT